jgi:hypothetical protein
MSCKPAVGSGPGSSWIRILLTLLDPDPYIVKVLGPDPYIECPDPQLCLYPWFKKEYLYLYKLIRYGTVGTYLRHCLKVHLLPLAGGYVPAEVLHPVDEARVLKE